TVLGFKVDRLSRCRLAGLFVLTLPHTQGFFAQAEFVRDTGDRSVRGVRIGLGMDDELDSTRLEFVGVFHWQERISFFQSPCLYYPRGDSPPRTLTIRYVAYAMQYRHMKWVGRRILGH